MRDRIVEAVHPEQIDGWLTRVGMERERPRLTDLVRPRYHGEGGAELREPGAVHPGKPHRAGGLQRREAPRIQLAELVIELRDRGELSVIEEGEPRSEARILCSPGLSAG